MDRIERLLTDWTTGGEKGYRVVGDVGTPRQSFASKKVGRIAIFTFVILVLGFTAYSFSPSAVVSSDALHGGHGRPGQHGNPKPAVAADGTPTGPPEIDWSALRENVKATGTTPTPQSEEDFYGAAASETPHVPGPVHADQEADPAVEEPAVAEPSITGQPVPEAPLKPQSEEDFYGAAPSETPHVPGAELWDEAADEIAEEPVLEPTATGVPVPEAEHLEPQSEEDFYGAAPEETPHVPGPESEVDEHREWGDPMPSEWEEPTPPEWDEPAASEEEEADEPVPESVLDEPQPEHKPDETKQDVLVETGAEAGEGPGQTTSEDRRLVVLVPVNEPSPNLCKFMVSAVALGYPSPIIVNWGRDPYEMSKWEGGPNLSKISGIMRYLDAVLREDAHSDEKLHDDDIVVIADGFDVWFQLPPEVLLKRYHDINARANARLREQWKHEDPMPMEQTVILAAQKRCWPSVAEGSNLHCEELPESPLRNDLYGEYTDQVIEPKVYSNFRPRYINGGVYIGAAGALRRMFRRAFDKVDGETSRGVHLFSEQGISGEVLGEQETWRNWRRGQQFTGNDATGLMEREFEYHIGLDYSQELSYPTCHSEKDGWVVPLGRQDLIDTHSSERNLTSVRVTGVPEDVRLAKNPLEGMVESPNWGDMPLYVDFFTETVPALLHHNAWKDNLKERRVWWWDQMWFYPYLRELLAKQLTPAPLVPLALVKQDERDITYWAPYSDTFKRKPRLLIDKAFEPLGEIEWDAVCRDPEEDFTWEKHWWDEVFRDGKGPL